MRMRIFWKTEGKISVFRQKRMRADGALRSPCWRAHFTLELFISHFNFILFSIRVDGALGPPCWKAYFFRIFLE